MSFVKSKVNLNFPKLKQLDNAKKKALEMTVDALKTEVVVDQVMPFRTDNLQNNSTFADYSDVGKGKVKLISSTPYARRVYFHPEYNFSHEENANAQGEWYKSYIKGKKKNFCKNAFSQFYKKEAGL